MLCARIFTTKTRCFVCNIQICHASSLDLTSCLNVGCDVVPRGRVVSRYNFWFRNIITIVILNKISGSILKTGDLQPIEGVWGFSPMENVDKWCMQSWEHWMHNSSGFYLFVYSCWFYRSHKGLSSYQGTKYHFYFICRYLLDCNACRDELSQCLVILLNPKDYFTQGSLRKSNVKPVKQSSHSRLHGAHICIQTNFHMKNWC